MRLLLDTHTLIWAGLSAAKLSQTVIRIIADPENELYVSAVSAWEIATKVRIGKLPEAIELERNFESEVVEAGYTLLPIEVSTALRAGHLPGDHRDPFDRLLAAQALAMDIPILSADDKLDGFGIRRIW